MSRKKYVPIKKTKITEEDIARKEENTERVRREFTEKARKPRGEIHKQNISEVMKDMPKSRKHRESLTKVWDDISFEDRQKRVRNANIARRKQKENIKLQQLNCENTNGDSENEENEENKGDEK